MNRGLSIQHWKDGFSSPSGVAVVFDVFRCSTTIHCLAARGLGSLSVAPSLEAVRSEPRVREMRVFSELSQPVECSERFDNSPFEAVEKPWMSGKPALVATTTGTPGMFAARHFEKVYVGSLVNFSALVAALAEYRGNVTLIPAAFPEWEHVEDEIACQALATALEGFSNIPEFVSECAENAKAKILASHRPEHLYKKLRFGREDISIALDLDRFSQVLSLQFTHPLFANVVKES